MQPTEQDWKKMVRVLRFVQATIDDPSYLGADNLTRFHTWVNVAFATHIDMKSHTGGVVSFGWGGFFCMSNKQKLVTKSSTEAEFVGASDYLPNTIWVKMFLECQGLIINECTFEQDNESAIRLEVNGRASATKQSRHIAIRYFWTKDRLLQHDIQVWYCNSTMMLADYLSKPLQGRFFE
ncbi:MAG: Ty1/Copia family ribonuclease HI [Myxococcota bacterium]